MKFYPTPITPKFLCFIFFAFLIILSCNKDNDEFENTVLNESATHVKEPVKEEVRPDIVTEETDQEEEVIDALVNTVYETRTTIFPAINDAHLQQDTGFNQNIVRLEEGHRTSYLMFDLSPIDSLGGKVNTTNLQFTIDSDGGNGTISVFKAISNDWSEEKLTAKTAPKTEALVGALGTIRYEVGQTQEVALDTAFIRNEILTLILTHEQGNDLAFASKENPNGKGPALVVTYNAPQDAEAIVFDDEIEKEFQADLATEETKTAPEDTAEAAIDETLGEEDTTEQVTTNGDATEEEAPKEETTTKEETAEETEEKSQEKEATLEEPSKEEIEEKSQEEEATVEAPTKGEITEETEENVQDKETSEETSRKADAPINEAPIAIAEASPTSGDAPLKVSFKGGSSSDDLGIKNYIWDFRDGSTSTEANPTHTFEKTGTLAVRLTVTDEQGVSHTDTLTITIKEEEKENEAPVANPKASTESGEVPLEVQFTGDESTDDAEITSYSWDFKDGSFSDSANTSHTFNEPGEYQVVLNVKDEQGLSNARIVVVTVTGAKNEAPVAKASGSPLSGEAPLKVSFRGSDSIDDEGITGYFWDFKDGSTTTDNDPTHTFSEPGEYNVKLDVRDKQGLTHSTTIKVTVSQPTSSIGGSGGVTSGNGGGGDKGSGGSGNNGGSNNGSNDSPSNGVKASSFGYNSSDATKAIEAAINSSNNTIIIDKQSSDWVVDPLWFKQLRNKTIIFEKGVVLRAKRGAYRPQDRLFQLENSENVEIQGYGATFAMNKSEYSGQQNHALSIINSSNITVKGLILTGAGGDGIYVSRRDHGEYCRNIVLDGVTSTQNQRQGMTVVSIDGLQIKNSTFSETSGESPGAGIDFEPETSSDRLDNIIVTNSTFKNNHGPGIMFAVNKASSSTRPIDANFRNIKVSNNSIDNPRLYPSEIDLGMSTSYQTNPVKGTITFDGLVVENSQWSAIYTKKTLEAYHVNVKNAVFKNVSKGGNEAAIHIGLLGYGNRSNANMGGFTFENVLIDYDGRAPSVELFGPGHGNWDLKNMKGEIRVRSPRGIRLEDNLNRLSNSSSSVNLRVVED